MTPAEPRRRRRASGSTHPWAFVVPAFVALAVFFLTPTLYNFVYAFTDWSSFKSSIRLTGWSNFAQLVSSGDLRRALVITLLYAGGVAVAQNLFGLGLALLLERDTVVNKVVRVVFFIPVVMSALAVGYVFQAPTLYNFVYAFTDWSSFKSSIRLTGWSNFAQLVSSGDLRRALVITLLYAGGVAVAQNLFGLGLALLLERDTVVNKVVRVVFFIPVVMSALAVGYVFQALLKPDGGVNQLLGALAGEPVSIAWLGSTRWTLLVVVLIHAWKWMGMSMLVYLAGLKTIDHQVLEAARIDGASRWQTLVRIRMPLIAPAVTFNVATALLGSMNSFDIVQATTGGGPGGSTELLNLYIFRTFGQGLYAQATTMSLVLFLAVVLLAFPVIGMLRRRERNMA